MRATSLPATDGRPWGRCEAKEQHDLHNKGGIRVVPKQGQLQDRLHP